MKEIEPSGQTPEQLLQYLDAQLALQRARKNAPSRNRAILLVSGVLLIVGAAAAALLVLEDMLVNQRGERRQEPQSQKP